MWQDVQVKARVDVKSRTVWYGRRNVTWSEGFWVVTFWGRTVWVVVTSGLSVGGRNIKAPSKQTSHQWTSFQLHHAGHLGARPGGGAWLHPHLIDAYRLVRSLPDVFFNKLLCVLLSARPHFHLYQDKSLVLDEPRSLAWKDLSVFFLYGSQYTGQCLRYKI